MESFSNKRTHPCVLAVMVVRCYGFQMQSALNWSKRCLAGDAVDCHFNVPIPCLREQTALHSGSTALQRQRLRQRDIPRRSDSRFWFHVVQRQLRRIWEHWDLSNKLRHRVVEWRSDHVSRPGTMHLIELCHIMSLVASPQEKACNVFMSHVNSY